MKDRIFMQYNTNYDLSKSSFLVRQEEKSMLYNYYFLAFNYKAHQDLVRFNNNLVDFNKVLTSLGSLYDEENSN